MTLPIICPHCGMSLTPAPEPEALQAPPDPTGHDDAATPPPDGPIPTEVEGAEPPPAAPDAAGPHRDREPISRVISSLPVDDRDDDRGEEDNLGASPILLGIDLETPAAPRSPADRPGESKSGTEEAEAHEEGHPEPGSRRSAWPHVLLISYASAVTLACGWLWWTGHRGRPADLAPWWVSDLDASGSIDRGGDADAGRRADASASVEPLSPIAEDRRVALGESLRVDALKITPLTVSAGAVTLERLRVDGKAERRDGGDEALRLRLRLRNASDDAIFAPMDEAFVREPDRRLPDTFIQDASGTRVYAYRLPVASEWTIAGQDFPTLRPGESTEVVVVSDVDATDRLDGPLTWRLRLRTAPETTTVVGVTFEASEIGEGD